jgi:hypothetical protein
MEKVLNFLLHSADGLVLYVVLFIVGSFVLYHLARLKNQRTFLFSTIKIISSVLGSKFGSKAEGLLEIFVDGLGKIQDGDFSNDDVVDWFLRYVRLSAQQKGISLTDEDVNNLHTLISSTILTFVGSNSKQIEHAVNQFNAFQATSIKQ